MKLYKQARKYGAQIAVGATALGGAVAAHAESSVPSAATMLTDLISNQSGYFTPMVTLALVSTGIMVAVKWVKRGRGAS